MVLQKKKFGTDPKDYNVLELFTTAFQTAEVKALMEAGIDIPTLIQLIIKDGAKAFTIAYGLFQLLTSGQTTVATIQAWVLANYKDAYSVAIDVAALFGITLPPLPGKAA